MISLRTRNNNSLILDSFKIEENFQANKIIMLHSKIKVMSGNVITKKHYITHI